MRQLLAVFILHTPLRLCCKQAPLKLLPPFLLTSSAGLRGRARSRWHYRWPSLPPWEVGARGWRSDARAAAARLWCGWVADWHDGRSSSGCVAVLHVCLIRSTTDA